MLYTTMVFCAGGLFGALVGLSLRDVYRDAKIGTLNAEIHRLRNELHVPQLRAQAEAAAERIKFS